jgi:D-glycero-D-manno-heptose 1,7-bisphosphate phosphatase
VTRWAVFFDRDGVLTEVVMRGVTAGSARTLDELMPIPGGRAAVEAVHAAGGMAIVVSNQPDVARGLLAPDCLEEMNRRLVADARVDAVLVCPHDGSEGCRCRKPSPGLLLDAADRFGLDLGACWMIGDRWVDVAAGEAAGARTVLLPQAYSWDATSGGALPRDLAATRTADDVAAAVRIVLDERERA